MGEKAAVSCIWAGPGPVSVTMCVCDPQRSARCLRPVRLVKRPSRPDGGASKLQPKTVACSSTCSAMTAEQILINSQTTAFEFFLRENMDFHYLDKAESSAITEYVPGWRPILVPPPDHKHYQD